MRISNVCSTAQCEADIAGLQIVSLQQWGTLVHTVLNSGPTGITDRVG